MLNSDHRHLYKMVAPAVIKDSKHLILTRISVACLAKKSSKTLRRTETFLILAYFMKPVWVVENL